MNASTNETAIAVLAKLMLELSPVQILPRAIGTMSEGEFGDILRLVNSKILEVHEVAPSLIIELALPPNDKDSPTLFNSETHTEEMPYQLSFYKDDRLIAVVGDHEPKTMEPIWIPEEPMQFCESLFGNLLQFAEAGYPGCEGCLGPAFDRTWDERTHRDSLLA
jgi:hypothetical protein